MGARASSSAPRRWRTTCRRLAAASKDRDSLQRLRRRRPPAGSRAWMVSRLPAAIRTLADRTWPLAGAVPRGAGFQGTFTPCECPIVGIEATVTMRVAGRRSGCSGMSTPRRSGHCIGPEARRRYRFGRYRNNERGSRSGQTDKHARCNCRQHAKRSTGLRRNAAARGHGRPAGDRIAPRRAGPFRAREPGGGGRCRPRWRVQKSSFAPANRRFNVFRL